MWHCGAGRVSDGRCLKCFFGSFSWEGGGGGSVIVSMVWVTGFLFTGILEDMFRRTDKAGPLTRWNLKDVVCSFED